MQDPGRAESRPIDNEGPGDLAGHHRDREDGDPDDGHDEPLSGDQPRASEPPEELPPPQLVVPQSIGDPSQPRADPGGREQYDGDQREAGAETDGGGDQATADFAREVRVDPGLQGDQDTHRERRPERDGGVRVSARNAGSRSGTW